MGCMTSSAAAARDSSSKGKSGATDTGLHATPPAPQQLFARPLPEAVKRDGAAEPCREVAEETTLRSAVGLAPPAPRTPDADDSAQEEGQPSSLLGDWDDMGFGDAFGRPNQRHSLVEMAAQNAMTKPPATILRQTTALRIDKCQGGLFVNQYLLTRFLGRGSCGKVFLCLNTYDLKLYAMKAVRKADLNLPPPPPPGAKRPVDPMDDVLREISIMKDLQHPNIVSLFEIIDDPVGNKLLLVMEYMDGGPLLTRESLDRRERVPESVARRSLRDMIKALDYLHNHMVVHGDLKPENVLVSTSGAVKLSDFGCSKVFVSSEYLDRCNGTPAFLAPEMMKPNSKYKGRPTDIYAMGACLYTLVFGRIPFNAPDVCTLFQVVLREPVTFPADVPISSALADLLQAMLHKNPKERITLAGLARHPWVSLNGRFPLKLLRELKPGETSELHDELVQPGRTFTELTPEPDLLEAVAKLGLVEHMYRQGDTIMRQGDKATFCLFITKGSVEILLKSSRGSQRILSSPSAITDPNASQDRDTNQPMTGGAAAERRAPERSATRGSQEGSFLRGGLAMLSPLAPRGPSFKMPRHIQQDAASGGGSNSPLAGVAAAGPPVAGAGSSMSSLLSARPASQAEGFAWGSQIHVMGGGLGSGVGVGMGTGLSTPGAGLESEPTVNECQRKLIRATNKAVDFVRELQSAVGGPNHVGDLLIAQREAGCLIGEMAMFSKTGQRTATVRCVTPVTARVILRDELERFLEQHPTFKVQMREHVMKRMAENNVVDALMKLANARDATIAMAALDQTTSAPLSKMPTSATSSNQSAQPMS